MNIPKRDLKFEYMRGTGPGGQHKNKTDSKVRITHIPTGTQASADERSQHRSKKMAMKELISRLEGIGDDRAAKARKDDRDRKIREAVRVRTYNKCRNEVTDHRSGLKRTFDDVLKRGNIGDFLDESKWDNV